jgi:competence protein ComEA
MKLCKVLFAAGVVLVSGVSSAAVNVNSADAATLDKELKGVGPKTAAAIVAEREKGGAFKGAEDLSSRVKGLGAKTVESNKAAIKFSEK